LLEFRRRTDRTGGSSFEALALQHLHGMLPGSLLGKALHYLTVQWLKLVRYVDDGRYPIDNNACENTIRPFVVGRRNWLSADTVAGTNISANLYSLLQTCMANGIEAYRYLTALLVELSKARTVEDFEALLPWCLAPAERRALICRRTALGERAEVAATDKRRWNADQQTALGVRTQSIDRLQRTDSHVVLSLSEFLAPQLCVFGRSVQKTTA
jgi:hypothetical protein